MMSLTDTLKTKSTQSSQRTVAADIGITEGMLSMVLSGKRRAGERTLSKIIRAYPELAGAAAIYLLEGLGDSS